MLLPNDYNRLGDVPQSIRSELTDLIQEIDWTSKELVRPDRLTTRIVRVPYNVRAEPAQKQTQQVIDVLDAFAPIDDWMHEKFNDHVFIRCEIACLMPHDELLWHIDDCWFHQYTHRIHMPITTNLDCFWCVDDREHHLPVGGYYEINNRRYHTYCNRGETPRLHLVFDIMENSLFEQARQNNVDLNKKTRAMRGFNRIEFFQSLPELLLEDYY